VQRNGQSIELADPATGQDLIDLESITGPDLAAKFIVACDVDNPLTGPKGAAAIFGPQKGATPQQVKQLDEALAGLVEALDAKEQSDQPGAGAAGGLGFAMLTFFEAQMRPGIGLVMETTNLKTRLAAADLCITGEGRLDASSLSGKAPIGVARLCKEVGIPCIAIAGSVDLDVLDKLREHFAACFAIASGPMTLDESRRDAQRLLTYTAANILKSRIVTRRARPQQEYDAL
jgi:glycerate kinase